jgi:hypothetical protein
MYGADILLPIIIFVLEKMASIIDFVIKHFICEILVKQVEKVRTIMVKYKNRNTINTKPYTKYTHRDQSSK